MTIELHALVVLGFRAESGVFKASNFDTDVVLIDAIIMNASFSGWEIQISCSFFANAFSNYLTTPLPESISPWCNLFDGITVVACVIVPQLLYIQIIVPWPSPGYNPSPNSQTNSI